MLPDRQLFPPKLKYQLVTMEAKIKKLFDRLLAGSLNKQFLASLRVEVRDVLPDIADTIVKRTGGTAQELFDRDSRNCPDLPARTILRLCCLVLASYRILVAETTDLQMAYSIVKGTISNLGTSFGRFMFSPLLWFYRDPVMKMSKINWQKWNQLIYGKSMEFGQENSADRVIIVVNKCAFYQFFVEHGEPQLTQVFCAWDRLWMDVLDRSPRPIRTERPTTISTGSNCCQFHCIRDAEKIGKAKNDVILGR
jgi:hypothetical protein